MNELKIIARMPIVLMQFMLGLIVAIASTIEVMGVAIFGVILGFTIGVLPALSIAFGVYALLRVVSTWITATNEQINFLARCIRDKEL